MVHSSAVLPKTDNDLPSVLKPITRVQIDAALIMHGQLEQWTIADRTLDLLASVMRDWSLESCVLKASTINTLYSTNVKWIVPVAQHVSRTIGARDIMAEGLVEEVALFSRDKKQIFLLSFASKFCHFFVNAKQYPIYDRLAVDVLGRLGANIEKEQVLRYSSYQRNICKLREVSNLDCSDRDLDKFLWLSGCYYAWSSSKISKTKTGKTINREVRELFERLRTDRSSLLEALLV